MAARNRDYLRHTVLIGSLTLVSRLLGLARDVVCASYFGAGAVWDAFSFAFRVPNLFRRLFGEGALSAAFIPIFAEYLELKERREAWRLAWVVLTATGAVLLACLLLGESLLLVIPRLAALNERWRLTLALSAVLLPYMVFVCLTAVAGAILNSLRHFTAPALAPVALNLCWIVAVVLVAPAVTPDPAGRAFVLAVGILAAGLFQLLLQAVALAKRGFPWRPEFKPGHPGLRRVALAMAPIVAGLAAFQVNVLLDGVIAISLSAGEETESFRLFGAQVHYPMLVGANSVLYYGNRLVQLPLGVFGIALATAVFPVLSAHAARGDWDDFAETFTHGLGMVLFIGLPAAAGMIVLGRPAAELLFERGAFTAEMSRRTAVVLGAYAAGLWAYCAHHVLIRAFYSLKDSATPAKVAGSMVVLNLALNLVLIWPLREAGLAAATAISAVVQSVVLYVVIVRRIRPAGQRRLLSTLARAAAAAAVMAAACLVLLRVMPPCPEGDKIAVKILRLCVPAAGGAAAYFAAAALLHVGEMRLLVGALKRTLFRGLKG